MTVRQLSENKKLYEVSRSELKQMAAEMCNDGDIVKVGKYYIHIKYGEFKHPSLKTTINTEDNIRDLFLHQWPNYITDFKNKRKSLGDWQTNILATP